MRNSLKCMALATLIALPVSIASGQEKNDGPRRIRIKSVVEDQDDAKSETKIEIRDGKLIIVDGQGNHQEIDVTGANVLSVTQSSSEEIQDGKVEGKSHGKAIIIGRDGKKMEIEFDGPVAVEGLPGLVRGPIQGRAWAHANVAPNTFAGNSEEQVAGLNLFQADSSKFFIGVMAEPVEATLRAQLGLDEGAGLVVRSVTPDSPAAKADLQEHDIILFADDTQLKDIGGLSEVVNQAGSDSKTMTLTLLRRGKEMRVELTPAERPEADLNILAGDLMLPGLGMKEVTGMPLHLDIQRLGPGLLLGAESGEQQEAMQKVHEDMQRAAEEMQVQMKQMQEQFKQSQEQMKRQLEESGEMMKRQMEELEMFRKKTPKGDQKSDSDDSSKSKKSGDGDR